MVWLRALRFDDKASQAVLADYLAAVEALLQRRSCLNEAIGLPDLQPVPPER